MSVSRDGFEVTTFEPGDHFGEISLLDKLPRSATVMAITDCKLLTITRKNFIELLHRDENLAVKLLWNMNLEFAKRLRASTQAISGLQKGWQV